MNSSNIFLTLLILPFTIAPNGGGNYLGPIGPIDPIIPGKPDLTRKGITLTTSLIGPYVKNQKDIVKVSLRNNDNQLIEVRLDLKCHNKTYGTIPLLGIKHIYINPKSSVTKELAFDNAYLNDEGLTYTFYVSNNDLSTRYLEKSITIMPYKKQSFDVNALSDKKVAIKRSGGRFLANDLFYLSDEIFDFSNSITTFEEASYYLLDINKFKFKYSAAGIPNFTKAIFSFKDLSNSFPLLANHRSVNLPLKLNQNDKKELFFTFANQLFVNPNTLEMSSKKLNSFIPTNKFYLPRNKAKYLIKYNFIFTIENLGNSQSDFKYSLPYFYNKNLLGDCNNSDFCVIGGMSND